MVIVEFRIFFTKWLVYWAELIQGVFGIITFTLWSPRISLPLCKKLARARMLRKP